MPIKSYQELFAWQKAIDLAEETYRISRAFPVDERFGSTAQLRRASVSLASNIAEGHDRGTTTEYIRYLQIARGSLAEAETQVVLSKRLGFVAGKSADRWQDLASEVGRLVNGLVASLRGRK